MSTMTRIAALIGYPLEHSISPIFQQPAFDYCKLDTRYEKWEVESSELQGAVDRVRESSCVGANVTVPYKEAVIPLLDGLDGLALDIGAVNTIVKRDDCLIGYNTDAGGFVRSLREQGGFDPKDKKVTMIGTGGVARAISFMLIKSGVQSLTMFDIDLERARKLALELNAKEITVLESNKGSEFEGAVSSAELLVNCTPIGMKHTPSESQSPVTGELISPGALVYDVVYNPIKTTLMKEAEKRGSRVVGGLSMLVYQGAESFELWTGHKAPIDIMMKRAQEAFL